jgi:hypothetical protein
MEGVDMPWTRKQVKYLLSNGSPLSSSQKEKMEAELHANPAMGHKKKKSRKHEVISAAASIIHKKGK